MMDFVFKTMNFVFKMMGLAFFALMDFALSRISELRSSTGAPEYEPDLATESLAARAQAVAASGNQPDPYAIALEIMLKGHGDGHLLYPHENYGECPATIRRVNFHCWTFSDGSLPGIAGGDLEVIKELLEDPYTISGLGDAGAHVGTICDGSYPTFLITHWARDRERAGKGSGLPLEFLVQKQTRKTAEAFGLLDRGLLSVGFKGDLNIIDLDRLSVTLPTVEYDLPGKVKAKRLMQRAVGYVHTVVSGVVVSNEGVPTGELPGRVIRGAQPLPAAAAAAVGTSSAKL